jgi:hypothetical protein
MMQSVPRVTGGRGEAKKRNSVKLREQERSAVQCTEVLPSYRFERLLCGAS